MYSSCLRTMAYHVTQTNRAPALIFLGLRAPSKNPSAFSPSTANTRSLDYVPWTCFYFPSALLIWLRRCFIYPLTRSIFIVVFFCAFFDRPSCLSLVEPSPRPTPRCSATQHRNRLPLAPRQQPSPALAHCSAGRPNSQQRQEREQPVHLAEVRSAQVPHPRSRQDRYSEIYKTPRIPSAQVLLGSRSSNSKEAHSAPRYRNRKVASSEASSKHNNQALR
jgi:hypothetical protein